MIDPALLVGTLSGMNVTPPGQAQEDMLLRALAERTSALAQDAQGAQQQYQQLASAPPPMLGGLDVFVPTLLSNIASVIARDPGYRERNQQNLGMERQSLLQSRAQNLQSLRDIYAQKAEAAQRSGDIEATEKFRLQHEKMSKLQEQVMETLKGQMQTLRDAEGRKFTAEQNQLDRENALRIAAMRPGAHGGGDDRFGGFDPDQVQTDVDNLATGRIKPENLGKAGGYDRVVRAEMNRQGKRIIPQKVRDAINEVGSARQVLNEIRSLSAELNTATPGAARIGQWAINQWGALWQTDAAAAQYGSARGSFAGNLARAVSAERGVLTEQDRDWAMRLIPTFGDAMEVAIGKLGRLDRFLAAKENNAVRAYSTALTVKNAPGVRAGGGSTAGAGARTHVNMRNPTTGETVPGVKIQSDDYRDAIAEGWEEY